MRNKGFSGLVILTIGLLIYSCEQPKSPDFEVNQEFEIPLTIEKTYQFLGGEEALLDTTSDDFDELFSSGGDGPVQLVKEEKINLGSLNDAIPEVDVASTSATAEVGEIELREFSSTGNVGTVSAGDIVVGGATLKQGDHLNSGSANGIQIDNFDPDFFESAIVKNDGTLNIVIQNNLGFNTDNNLTIKLKSNGSLVGSDDISALNHTETDTAKIPVSAGTHLINLGVEIDVGWSDQTMQADAGSLVVSEMYGQDDTNPSNGLMLSQVTAKVASQSFNTTGSAIVNNSNFEFRQPGDQIQLSDSTQNVNKLNLDISNNIGIGIQQIAITFDGIDDAQGNSFSINIDEIPANSGLTNVYDISEHTITDETVSYTIAVQTENTQGDSNPNTIKSTDDLAVNVGLQQLDIGRARGYIVPKQILLNQDNTPDNVQNLDVFNDDEADLTEVDSISELSEHISNIEFENPVLSMLYNTNLGVQTTVYAVIAGTAKNGDTKFLKGINGSKHEVQESEIPPQLMVDGQPASSGQVLKFRIETAQQPDPAQGEQGANEFNATNTNSSEFFSNFPSSIRFVGVAAVNEEEQGGTVVNPVIFDPSFAVQIPFNLTADNATYQDTVDANLSDLPDGDGDSNLSEALLGINYTNGLPLGLTLDLVFIDANGSEIARKSGIEIEAASTDGDGYVSASAKSEYEISFSKNELDVLHRSRNIVFDMNVNTSGQQSVNIKESDSVSFKVRVKAGITSKIN